MSEKKEYIVPVGEGVYEINTGDWRTHRPVLDQDKCIKCGICLTYCPVFSIYKEGEEYRIDFSYCKGCGVCMHECPKDAIQMVEEGR